MTAEGAGAIVATDNGDPTCHIPFAHTGRPAFNGLLLAIVKGNPGAKGKLRIRVSAPGLRPAMTIIHVKEKR